MEQNLTYTDEELFAICENNINGRCLELPEEIFDKIDISQAYSIKEYLKGRVFVKLPNREIKFFEWLKNAELPVWEDLWADEIEQPYLVSAEFLPHLIKESRGFPICDLVNCDNYYFAPIHVNGREAGLLVDTIKQRFMNKDKLTPAQTLLMEVSLEAIDIWHFAYKYKIELEIAKEAVAQLVDDQSIVHFKSADHLANFIEI